MSEREPGPKGHTTRFVFVESDIALRDSCAGSTQVGLPDLRALSADLGQARDRCLVPLAQERSLHSPGTRDIGISARVRANRSIPAMGAHQTCCCSIRFRHPLAINCPFWTLRVDDATVTNQLLAARRTFAFEALSPIILALFVTAVMWSNVLSNRFSCGQRRSTADRSNVLSL